MGLVNSTLMDIGVIDAPFEWLLYSQFSVILAFVHLYTLFMVVPIFNSMMRIDRSLLEAAHDAGASTWQTLDKYHYPTQSAGDYYWLDIRNNHCNGRFFDHRSNGRPANPVSGQDYQC